MVTADAQVRYDPPTDQVGTFRCTYEVTNSRGLRAGASIIITVREPLLTNEPPIAVDDTLTVEVGAIGSKDVTSNDSDPDGSSSPLTVVSSTAPSLGTAARRGNVITFTAPTTVGVTTIKYQVADIDGGVSTGQLTVIITEKANVPPIATADVRNVFGPGVATVFDVLANDLDPDATTGGLSLVSASKVSGDGTVSPNGRLVTLTPDAGFVGSLVASYTISDGAGLEASAQVTLNVLEPLNRPPVARDDSNEVANGASITTAVLFNDSDPDGDPLVDQPHLGARPLTRQRTAEQRRVDRLHRLARRVRNGRDRLRDRRRRVHQQRHAADHRVRLRRIGAGGRQRDAHHRLPAADRCQPAGVRDERDDHRRRGSADVRRRRSTPRRPARTATSRSPTPS